MWTSNHAIIMAFVISTILLIVAGDSLVIVRGVSLKEQGLYNPAQEFTCFDGSKTIPFKSVNDDYCDCVDGSDEPGTSACPEGKFYCQNLGHIAKYLQSSRVNDGICDCCDGSDEYDSPVVCFNECEQEGKEEQVRLQQLKQETNAGCEIRKNYIQTGEERKHEKKVRSDTLSQLLEERRAKLEELKTVKETAESPEKEAKEKHENAWNEQQAKKKAEQEQLDKMEAFPILDVDKNGWVSFGELMSHQSLKDDMSENDAKDILGGEALVDAEGFDKVWPAFKDRYLKNGRPQPAEENPEVKGEGEEGDENKEEESPSEEIPPTTTTEEQMPEYDEVTKALIEAAESARRAFDEVDKEVRDLEAEQTTINEYFKIDFGQENEFAALKGECFEFTDREYTYKLCLFDSVTQRQKTGGSETDLGKWGNWQDDYSAMKYSGGQSCWNGPARSALVRMSCGQENALLSVVEPSRCEYEMEFKTPALCVADDGSPQKTKVDDEL